ncbi:MAG: Ni/Fe hydrogenase subunit alpha [Anaerolineae bacterium]|nr:Ni/Fe hydrogenase subunit alpha [Anaerolineae bacterium]
MTKTITIDPVTRIEGHSKISIQLDDSGKVTDAHFHVTQVRGFEKFVEGRPFHEMPSLTARICGICPVSHLLASAKACDGLLAVRIPPTATKLRKIMNLAQIAQSHALSFFYLSAPDLLLGMDADPAERNIFGLMRVNPELVRGGVKLRQTGQQIIELLGGKRVHPSWIVPGGVSEPLTEEKRDQILAMLPEAIGIAWTAYEWYAEEVHKFKEEIESFANFPTLFMGLVSPRNTLAMYGGDLRVVASNGAVLEDHRQAEDYLSIIAEKVEPFSYLKSPYYKPIGYPSGIYRVGPLARMNIIDHPGTRLADAAFEGFKTLDRQSSFHYHYARLIELLYCFERTEQLLHEPDILDRHVRAQARPNAEEGVGISEAPRGTLIHHYRTNKDGLITYANLIIATGNNNLAMDRGVLQVAKRFVDGERLNEGMLNRVEAVIRAYDPCLSCSTHAVGKMPLEINLVAPDGAVVDTLTR